MFGSPLSSPTVLTACPILTNFILLYFSLMSGNCFPTCCTDQDSGGLGGIGGVGQVTMTMIISQSCLTLCDLMGYTVHGILQARILEWVAVPFSRGSSQSRDSIQGSNPGLPHCRRILYQLSRQRSPGQVKSACLLHIELSQKTFHSV